MPMEDCRDIIEGAEKALEEVRKARRRWQSPEHRKKMRKLYSNRRAMKKMVRIHEGRLAVGLANLDWSEDGDEDLSYIEGVIEWFLTWRLKLEDYSEAGWCDGVQDLELTLEDKRTYQILGKMWAGPEHNVRIQYLCDLSGTIVLSQKRQRLKSYRLEIIDRGKTYLVRKAT